MTTPNGLRTRVGWQTVTLPIYGNIGRYPVYSPLVIPPKDAQIGIRSAGGGNTGGETDWMPATVESYDGTSVIVLGPTNGIRTVFDARGNWEWDFATNIRFADICWECKGTKERPIGESVIMADCLTCSGYGSIQYRPFRAKRRRKAHHTARAA